MAEDYFDQEDDGEGMSKGMDEGKGEDGKKSMDGKTAVINSEICPGMEPGDVMELRIEEVHDGEYVVSYEPKENKVEHGKDMGPEDSGGGADEGSYASMLE